MIEEEFYSTLNTKYPNTHITTSDLEKDKNSTTNNTSNIDAAVIANKILKRGIAYAYHPKFQKK
jgi:hypothetical protein